MGAVFALFSGWYFWIPKILGLDYNLLYSKAHFWVLFAGVNLNGSTFSFFFLIIYFINYVEKKKQIGKRLYSGFPSGGSPFNPKEFSIFFNNFKEEKKDIYRELRKKSGVYMLINNINKGIYIGSSVNLTRRMATYYYYTNSDKSFNIVIIRALKKYGLENFSLGILEFCKQDSNVCLKLEQKWLDHYKPNYNVLTVAGNSFGFKHSIETITNLKKMLSKENHPKFGYITSSETKKAIGEGIKNFYLTNSNPRKGLKGKLSAQYGIGGNFVFCYNKTNEELIFPSINAAKQHFKVRWTYIKKNMDSKKWVTLQGEDWIIQSVPRQK